MNLKFAVLGDTHYCLNSTCRKLDHQGALSDPGRYSLMRGNLIRFAAMIRREKPDLLISTGDLIEGGFDDHAEYAGATELFAPCAPEFFVTRGTHDRKQPCAFQTFERAHCRFILLDYTVPHWNEEQKQAFRAALAQGKSAERIFVFAHAPLYPWGREAFDNPVFRTDVEEILQHNPVDVYFCGHTHNQSLSIHSGNRIQVMASSVGYDGPAVVALSRYHALRPRSPSDRLLWGIAEDSAPAFWIVELNGGRLVLRWHSLFSSAEAVQESRWLAAECRSVPPFAADEHSLTRSDCNQIRCGWLNLFSSEKEKPSGARVAVNGIPAGALPANGSCAARRFLMLPPEVLDSIGTENRITIGPIGEKTAVVSASLELVLLDGRIIRSLPSEKSFRCGSHPDFVFAERMANRLPPGASAEFMLSFQSEKK